MRPPTEPEQCGVNKKVCVSGAEPKPPMVSVGASELLCLDLALEEPALGRDVCYFVCCSLAVCSSGCLAFRQVESGLYSFISFPIFSVFFPKSF
jgi:hypothetical protein